MGLRGYLHPLSKHEAGCQASRRRAEGRRGLDMDMDMDPRTGSSIRACACGAALSAKGMPAGDDFSLKVFVVCFDTVVSQCWAGWAV